MDGVEGTIAMEELRSWCVLDEVSMMIVFGRGAVPLVSG